MKIRGRGKTHPVSLLLLLFLIQGHGLISPLSLDVLNVLLDTSTAQFTDHGTQVGGRGKADKDVKIKDDFGQVSGGDHVTKAYGSKGDKGKVEGIVEGPTLEVGEHDTTENPDEKGEEGGKEHLHAEDTVLSLFEHTSTGLLIGEDGGGAKVREGKRATVGSRDGGKVP